MKTIIVLKLIRSNLPLLRLSFTLAKYYRCRKLSAPDNGDIELSGIHPGSNAAYSCEKGYTLVGDDTRKCQRNGQWTGSAPICQSE